MNTDKKFTMSLRKIYPEMVVHKLPSVTREYKVYEKKKKEVLKELTAGILWRGLSFRLRE